jgi:hypothetical protein
MIRLLRFVLVTVVVSAAACSGGTTAPPAPNKLTPNGEALTTEGDSGACRGYTVTNGRTC